MLSRQRAERLGKMENRDCTLDWTGLSTGLDSGVIFFFRVGAGVVLFFSSLQKITFSTFPQQAIFFPFFAGGWGGGVGKGIVLYRLYSSLLFVGCVLCLSFLVLVGGLDWSLCLTHGRHVSLES